MPGLDLLEFVQQPIVLGVADDRIVEDVVTIVVKVDLLAQLDETLFEVGHGALGCKRNNGYSHRVYLSRRRLIHQFLHSLHHFRREVSLTAHLTHSRRNIFKYKDLPLALAIHSYTPLIQR